MYGEMHAPSPYDNMFNMLISVLVMRKLLWRTYSQRCIQEVREWLRENFLLLNDKKN